MINLASVQFSQSNLFRYLPRFEGIFYDGLMDGKIQQFRAVREGEECRLLALSFLRQEEDFLWDATEDFLTFSLKEAAARAHGIFTYDLLAFDIQKEINAFNYAELSTLIVNHSYKLHPGEKCAVKYSSLYGILQKLVSEDWGKMTLKTAVEIFKDQPPLLYLLLKRIFTHGRFSHGPVIFLLNDLSSHPVFAPADARQQEGLKKVLKEQLTMSMEFPPEVYIQDKSGAVELLSNSRVG